MALFDKYANNPFAALFPWLSQRVGDPSLMQQGSPMGGVPGQPPGPMDTGVMQGPPDPGAMTNAGGAGGVPLGPPATNGLGPPSTNGNGGSAVRSAGPPQTSTGAPAPGGGGMGANPTAGGMIRYPTNNPKFALQSAMQDMGANPFRADPYMSMLMNYAPGLATSFLMKNVGADSSSIAGQGGEGAMFGNYLKSVLGQGGGLSSALSGASGGLGNTLHQLTAIQDQMAGTGQNLAEVNPFAQFLMDMMADPSGASGMMGSLTTPFMSSRVGQSYLGGLQDVAGQALRRRGDDLNQSGNPRNFWDYLFPGM